MRTDKLLLLSGVAAVILAGCATGEVPPQPDEAAERDYLNAGVIPNSPKWRTFAP